MTPLRILFAIPSPEYLRYYDATIRLLAERGHAVAVTIARQKEAKQARLDGLISGDVTFAGFLPPRTGLWRELANDVRGTMDFIRYLDPRFASAGALRDRMKRKALPWYLHWLDRQASVPTASVQRWLHRLTAVERAIPDQRDLTAFLAEQSPDVIVISPLVEAGGAQVDLVKSARALGVPSVVGIASWDNLTNKGLLRIQPDAVMLWNEAQKREAIELHGIAPESIVVTGAQPFDRWFGRQPTRSRDEFCRRVGLPADRPIVLFTGSSVFISRGDAEVPFVRRWIQALRTSARPTLRAAVVLMRPHPYNADQWRDVDLSGLGTVAVWPRGRHNPVDEDNRADYFDSLFYSAAVVGINTSAMVEATILGRPVLSIQADEFARTQEGTLHFHHLLPENGGFLRLATTLEQHVTQLEEVLERPEVVQRQLASFVASFLRPHGLTQPAVPIVADTLESVARVAHARHAAATALAPARFALAPLAVFCLAAEKAAPLAKLSKEPKKLAARVARLAFKWPHRARLTSRHYTRTARKQGKATVVYGYRGGLRMAARAARLLVIRPLRVSRRVAARVLAVAAGRPSEPRL
ncbi:MAG TPA: hypothetical protein VNJ02_04955 [Vicinamibacterales bacterium]|nr:hypothetical protein [Vicinamibacterales bacterium]